MSGYATKPIPPALARQLEAMGLPKAPATLGELVTLALSTQGPITDPEALCSATDSRHQVTIEGATRHTHCVLDTLILPFALDRPGLARSVSPLSGTNVELRVSPDGIEAEPPDAVVSFGARRDGDGTFYEIWCPYINAFGSIAEYERWASATPEAVTIVLSVAEAFALAHGLSGNGAAEG